MTAANPGKEIPSGTRTLISIGWVYLTLVIEKLATFGATAVLARILMPEQFGVIATALLIIGFVSTFRDFGIPEALVYLDDDPQATAETAFWLNLIIGFALTALLVAAAPFISWIVKGPQEFTDILRVMSLFFVFNALGSVHRALLRKRLMFLRRSTVDVVAAFAKAAITITLAYLGYGVWSLVIGFVAGSAVRSIGLWIALPWLPRLNLAREQGAALLRYGKHVLFVGVMGNFSDRIDQVVVLLFFGKLPLAYYYIAARIPEILIVQIGRVLTNVLFPTYALMKSSKEAVAFYVVETTRYMSYALFPIAIGISLTANELIAVAFGTKWAPAAPFLTALSLCTLFDGILWATGDGFKAIGRPDVLTRMATIHSILAPPVIVTGVALFEDPIAAPYSLLATILIVVIFQAIATKQVLGIAYSTLLKVISPAALSSLAMVPSVMIANRWLTDLDLPNPAILTLEVIVGALTYLSILSLIDGRKILRDIASLVRGKRECQSSATLLPKVTPEIL